MTDFLWTDERVECIRKLWLEGHSAGYIAAKEFNNECTRNAVIGKLSRLGLTRAYASRQKPPVPIVRLYHRNVADPDIPQPKRKRRRRKKKQQETATTGSNGVRMPKFEPEPFTIIDDSDIPIQQRRSLMQLTSHTCRWPCGDPGTPGFFFCGAEPVRGLPYCALHSKRAYSRQPTVRQTQATIELRRRARLRTLGLTETPGSARAMGD